MALILGNGYFYVLLAQQLASSQETLTGTLALFQDRVHDLETKLSNEKNDKAVLSNLLSSEKSKNEYFAQQISGIQGTVNILEKLSKTDKELLQKYSKVYFLNEHYIPENLSVIDKNDTYNKTEIYQIHTKVQPYLYQMLRAASSSNVSMETVSAYRSFGEQASLKLGYKIIYGSGANQFSADQGFSEHQLGTTVDLTTKDNVPFSKFESTQAYKWLQENAHRFGFVLSYPKNNQYYVFEPWHWRFVGIKLATELYNRKIYFYGIDQREIDSYLISIFD
ncbi:MAG: hypothetical protein A2418_02235 [Candidatus Brennerbacteria bacterium RIFOXYC1_FULL_41_11]|uniref:D-alanyl-D-alanine carboxypeptidase-like core domain-containing protein n=1 Tax=Candidatus Brennerbacteria bacterium RIFOXYD1_FULL_41_16 TaxID=1797529 RepID=A0A1G1XMV1_9BACT|nr:MAG: hypothetical protein A2391_00330 [Candidatus Brennerbacteria bacterium RIFOXYB1_FULL_41_13]OGY40139.1 MAG: hypothetical protein A2418_02235 [Candidatus Brennerbacteria bacterium RIFOXYC1_FULL_41_11]OGY41006.1 MAG: hypothetical protein A2570_01740 [Candidatus Brennerbacteria bacterium RIFOXYD1_FULL_41_16]